ncbi:MAG TPA: hypothetical protein VFH58_05120 [Acidimicrobiales bacterium]|nr:hypothetical protein [Acidimicrobiales bacterium]
MNPWITEPLAAAHRADLLRTAAARDYPRAGRPTGGRHVPVPPRHLLALRMRVGEVLMRTGSRLAGGPPLPLGPYPPGA